MSLSRPPKVKTLVAIQRTLLLAALGALLSSCGSTPSPTIEPTAVPTPLPIPSGARIRTADQMVMVYVPAGEFIMGSTDTDLGLIDVEAALKQCPNCSPDWFSDELPQHTVYLDAFWVDWTEITNAQYQICVEAGVCGKPKYWNSKQDPIPNYPVTGVDWYSAQTYCERAGARLPTEAEWEKAARGTDGRIYPWGNAFLGGRVNHCDQSCPSDWKDLAFRDGFLFMSAVGSFPDGASPYGVLDMGGNVWEWTNDWYDAEYYGQSPSRNPEGPTTGTYRAVRGGSYADTRWMTRCTTRGAFDPTHMKHDGGFRCVTSQDPP